MEQRFFISCPKGVEQLLADEFEALGFSAVKQTIGGIYAEAEFERCYSACLLSRLANRVVWVLVEDTVPDKKRFYQIVNDLAWTACFSKQKTFSVDFKGTNDYIKHSNYGALLLKDAVVDHFNEHTGSRPDVSAKHADVTIYAHLRREKLMLGIEVSGGSLHRRGYRLSGAKAPLKENLAAALIKRIPDLKSPEIIVDPMCGSGTLLIEGVMQKLDLPSQILRENFGFEHLIRFNSSTWKLLLTEQQQRHQSALAKAKDEGKVLAIGFDSDVKSIAAANQNIERAGLVGLVECKHQALKDFPTFTQRGLLLCNPPYGERLDERNRLFVLYQQLGQMIKQHCQRWQVAILSSDDHLLKALSLQKSKSYQFYNGAIPAQWLLFEIYAQASTEEKPKDEKFEQAVQMVANRLRKNKKKLEKWAVKTNISCYRLYDADMPEYAFALDCYQGHYQLTEYAPPKTVDSFAAFNRRAQFEQAVCLVFELAPKKLYIKERRQQKGNAQYEKIARSERFFKVTEGNARLWVNLIDYLDTGLFLDHRPVRKMLADKAQDKRFLNLFSYTSVASVHVAMAGAASSLSVDMSKTYIEWSERNFKLNNIDTEKHQLHRDDVLSWLDRAQMNECAAFDLIFLDPPSFSNSKRMDDTLDIQRDHQGMIEKTMKLLDEKGELYFSNNRKGFKLDAALSDLFTIEDITRRTIDTDFERNSKIHQCWVIKHK